MTGSFDLKVNFLTNRLLRAVSKMVSGMRNSIHAIEIDTICSELNASVMLWPIVNAVTIISSCFQSLNW